MKADIIVPAVSEDATTGADECLRGDSSNLDLLRSAAVLFVVLCHLPSVRNSIQGFPYHIGALGLLGVVIFFVHTCLVLLLSLRRQLEKQGRQGFATSFYIRRAFRIYPLSMVVVLTVAALPLLTSQAVPSAMTIASNLFLVQNLTGHDSIPAPLWSLPFEIQMYLVLPLLFLAMERSGVKAVRLVGFLWVATIALVIGLWKLGLNYHLVKYFPCFIPGAIAYALRKTRKSVTPMLLFGYVVACALLMPFSVANGARENVVAWPVCLGLGLLIPRCREVQSKVLTRVGKLIARYSYGIYLVHGTCITFTFGAMSTRHPVVQWAGFLAATTGLALVAYHLIEKPGIGLGIALANKWAQRLRPLPEPAAPALGE